MNLVACTSNAVDTANEPTKIVDDLKNMTEPVIEKVEAAIEKVILEELTVAIEQSQVVLEAAQVDPVVVEEPVSIEERM